MLTRSAVILAAVALALSPFKGFAGEDHTSNEHSAAMAKGMTHDQAVADTNAKHPQKVQKRRSHSDAMAAGMTHDQAVAATQGTAKRSKAAAHAKAMDDGMTHDQAAGQSSK